MLNWKKLNKYCIYAKEYTVAVYYGGETKYAAWYGKEILGWYNTAKEAKDEAISHYTKQLTELGNETSRTRLEEIMGGNSP